MITEEKQYLFDQYLLGKLTLGEKTAFEQKIVQEEAFKKEFQNYQEFSRQVELAFLKEDLERIHKTSIIKTKKTFTSKFWYVAASVVIIGAIGTIWLLKFTNSSKQLFDAYFIKDPGLPTVMGTTKTTGFQNAMVQYKQGNYQNARKIWLAQDNQRIKNDTLHFYISMSYLNENNFTQAKHWLNSETLTTSSRFYKEAIWYKALIHLYEGEKEKALNLLYKIQNFPKAKELIANIENEIL